MPTPITLSASAGSYSSGLRLLVCVGGKRAQGLTLVTGKRTGSAVLRRLQLHPQQHSVHTWVSGHPHSLLHKPPTAVNKASTCANVNNVTGNSSGPSGSYGCQINSSSSSGNSPSFFDFAGNSRYQAYHLTRFSTLSVASSSSPPTPPKQDSSSAGSSSNQQDRVQSNPASADAKSSLSSSSTTATPSSSGPPHSSKDQQDDKEDDWAVNESYSGHSGHGFVTSSGSASSTGSKNTSSESSTSTVAPRMSNDTSTEDDGNPEHDASRTALQPSPSPFKSPAMIDASWRRTSEILPSVTIPPGTSILSSTTSSKAGGLDLSSSTLVQQMLFKERAPHADSSETEIENRSWEQPDEGNFKSTGPREKDTSSSGDNERNEDNANNNGFDDWDDVNRTGEREHSHG